MTRFYPFSLLFFILSALWPAVAVAQEALPTVEPKMVITTSTGEEVDDVTYDGSAPAVARFTANPQHQGAYEALYEWQFVRQGESEPFLIRYDENTDYTFAQSGAFTIKLLVTFVAGTDSLEYEQEDAFKVNISESKLEVPNAFSPNGDVINDVFKVKEGYQSIVSFKARIFSRWGKLLYEWSNLDGGWDGRSGGSIVPDGGYYLNIQAKGADGKVYDIKKVINVLTGFTENEGGTRN